MFEITGYEELEDSQPDVPEEATTVGAPQVPALPGWTLNPENTVWIVLAVLAAGFGIWFITSYSKAKTLALAAVVKEASDG